MKIRRLASAASTVRPQRNSSLRIVAGGRNLKWEVMPRQGRQLRHHLLPSNFGPGRPHRRSITVAPIQTLTDKDISDHARPELRRDPCRGRRDRRVEIQFAVNPDNGRMVIHEMNPRVSRSSGAGVQGTGFPSPKSPPNSPSAICSTNQKRHHARNSRELRADH